MKTIIYIDGQNFLYKAAERLIDAGVVTYKQAVTSIDLPYLFSQIVPHLQPEIRFYGVKKIKRQTRFGADIKRKSVQFANNLRRVRSCLQKTGVKFCATGTLKVRDRDQCKQCGATDYKYQEKGVDVGLAVDIVNDVLTKQTDHVILVSSDTDLIPAIKIAKAHHAQLTYVGFNHQLTKAISILANSTKIIHDRDLITAYERLNPPHRPFTSNSPQTP